MKPRGGKRPFRPPASIFNFKCLQPTLSLNQKNGVELQSPVLAKKIWNFFRVAYFMMKKGIISKRKLLMDVNLLMRRGKYLGKAWGKSLIFHHHNQSGRVPQPGAVSLGLAYEFSCSNSPSPVFFQAGSASKRRYHVYFPCINNPDEDDEDFVAREVPMSMPTVPSIEYSPESSYGIAPGETFSPQASPLSVLISNYSSEEESECPDHHVDTDAEDFIQNFYERLRAQCRVQLLQYQEMEYQEMLARGAT